MKDCIFCNIVAGEVPAEKVYQDEWVVGFRDLNPQAPVHVLLIPRKHIATINDIQIEDEVIVGRLISAAREIAAEEGLSKEGYRVVMNCNEAAGQSVFHIHLHLLGGRTMAWPPG